MDGSYIGRRGACRDDFTLVSLFSFFCFLFIYCSLFLFDSSSLISFLLLSLIPLPHSSLSLIPFLTLFINSFSLPPLPLFLLLLPVSSASLNFKTP